MNDYCAHPTCGRIIHRDESCQRRRYCSERCKRREQYRLRIEREEAGLLPRKVYKPVPRIERACSWALCNQIIPAHRDPRGRYCQPACRKDAWAAARRARRKKATAPAVAPAKAKPVAIQAALVALAYRATS